MLRAIGAVFRALGMAIYHTARIIGVAIYFAAISIRAVFRFIEKDLANIQRQKRRRDAETASSQNAELRQYRLHEARRRAAKH